MATMEIMIHEEKISHFTFHRKKGPMAYNRKQTIRVKELYCRVLSEVSKSTNKNMLSYQQAYIIVLFSFYKHNLYK